MPVNDTTANRSYQKPNIANTLSDDVGRLRSALDSIDTDMASKAPSAGPTFTGVATVAAGSAAAPSLTFTGATSDTGLYSPGADQVAISTGGTGRVFVASDGKVGIGTSSPPWLLSVRQDTGGITAGNYPTIQINNANAVGYAALYLNDGTAQAGLETRRDSGHLAFYAAQFERARIDSSGRLLVGASSPRAQFLVTPQLEVEGTTSSSSSIGLISNQNSIAGPYLFFGKTRGSSVGSVTAVQAGDILGGIYFQGANGSDLSNCGALIESYVDAEPFTSGDTTDLPGRLVFGTTADGAAAPTERMRITSDGKVGIGTSSPRTALDLGTVNSVLTISDNNTPDQGLRLGCSRRQNYGDGLVARNLVGATGTDSLATPATGGSGYCGTEYKWGGDIFFYTSSASTTANSVVTPPVRLAITAAGNVCIGTSTARSNLFTNYSPTFQLETAGTLTSRSASIYYNGNNTGGAVLALASSRGTAVGSNTVVQSGDELGQLAFLGADGTNAIYGAVITAAVDGTPGLNDMPGRLVFGTTADGASSPTERLRIDSAGTTTFTSAASTAPAIFKINTTEVGRWDSSGRLLVGTSTSSSLSKFIITGGAGTNACRMTLAFGNATPVNGNPLGVIEIADSGQVASARIEGQRDGGTWTSGSSQPSSLVFSTTADGVASPTERMRITSSGYVGIGNASPDAPLSVTGTGASNATLVLYNGTDTNPTIITNNASASTLILKGGAAATGSRHGGQIDLVGGLGAADPGVIKFRTGTTTGEQAERARIDSSGRLLVGTSTARTLFTAYVPALQVETTGVPSPSASFIHNSNDGVGATLFLGKSRGGSAGSNTAIANGDDLGVIAFNGADGTDIQSVGATIKGIVDGPPGADDLPTRLVFSTTADGAATPTEQLRISSAGTVIYNQPAPAAVDTSATLTVANLTANIITSTTAAAVTMTLPTGTNMDAGFSGLYNNMAFEWTVINTGGTNAVTVQGNTDHTVVGSGTVAASGSGRFLSRRTAGTTWVTYRLAT